MHGAAGSTFGRKSRPWHKLAFVVSAGLLLGVWLRSYWRIDLGRLYLDPGGSRAIEVISCRGILLLGVATSIDRQESGGTGGFGWMTLDRSPGSTASNSSWLPNSSRAPLGLGYVHIRCVAVGLHFMFPLAHETRGVQIPYCVLALALAGWWLLRRFRRKPPAGCCPQCGYDLRATPQRCPECAWQPEDQDATTTGGERGREIGSP